MLHAILSQDNSKNTITNLYIALQSDATPALADLREHWSADISSPLSDVQWDQALHHVKEVSRNMRLRFTQINYLHRTYLTPHRIAKMYPGAKSECPRCRHHKADFIHMVWSCPVLEETWHSITDILSEVVETPVLLTPESCLLGIRTQTKQTKYRNKLINLALALFKQLIAMNWKSHTAPNIKLWLKLLLKWAQAESFCMSEAMGGKKINEENTLTGDNYMSKILAKNDDRPP